MDIRKIQSNTAISNILISNSPPSIITSNLVLNLDAANPSSYPGTGSTWFDISGNNNNATLYNGISFSSGDGGSLVFDGINDYAKASLSSTVQVRSFSIWFYTSVAFTPDFDPSSNVGYSMANFGTTGTINSYDGITKGNWTGGATNETIGYYQHDPQGFIYMTDTVSIGWHQFAMNYNSSAGIYDFFVDGVQKNVSIATQGNRGLMSTNRVIIGSSGDPSTVSGTTYYGKHNFSQILLYTTALTSQQILQNFDAVRGRYNI